MSFKLIREAQELARLGRDAKYVQRVSKLIGTNSVVGLTPIGEGEGSAGITPNHYTNWLNTMRDHAADAGIGIDNKTDFQTVAHDMLDNDSQIDALAGRDTSPAGRMKHQALRRQIVDNLWNAHKTAAGHSKVQDHMASLPPGAENEESSRIRQARQLRKVSPTISSAINKKSSTNPYPAGSLRASLWNDLHASEDEEEDLDNDYDDNDDDISGNEDQTASHQDEPDTSSMSPDQLAVHITGVYPNSDDGMDDNDRDNGDDGDLEDRVAELEQRVSDIEGTDADVGNDELLDRERDNDPEMDQPKNTSDQDDMDDQDADTMGDDQYNDDDGSDDPIADERNKPSSKKMRALAPEDRFTEDEELSPVHKSLFHAAISQPKVHMQQALKDVEDQGATAWLGMQMPKCPHPKGSAAHNAWHKGMKNAACAALGINTKPRETSSTRKKRR